MPYVVRIGSKTTEESVVGPFASRAAATAFRDRLQAHVDALPKNRDRIWTAVSPLGRPALSTLVRQWGLRRPDDSMPL